MTLPDSGQVHTTYWATGEVKRQWGSRQYPVEYAYAKGRMVGLTTWQDFAGDTGRAVTTWFYDAQRGWLTSKEYADEKGPSYTYYPSGKLDTRTWARGIVTTYTYTNAGELAGVDYSDTTTDIGYVYDRVGRKAEVTDAVGTHTWTYTDEGLTDIEAHTAGPLVGWSVDHDYDALLRRGDVKVKEGTTQRALTHATYDDAGRHHTIGDGTNTATYSYLANSHQVEHIDFNNGAEDVMRTTKSYDGLDRLTAIGHQRLPNVGGPGPGATVSSYAYTYNTANQRVRVTEVDGSYWVYGYDALGQVTSGKKYFADDTLVPGWQFEYGFDDIGNRKTTGEGGNNVGGALRAATYEANELNQYTSRTVPAAKDITGSASAQALVFVNQQPAWRKGSFWQALVEADNAESPAYPEVRVDAIKPGTGPNGEDVASTQTGHTFIAETPEVFTYDDDGNLTADGRWLYGWNGENRLVQIETDPSVGGAVPSGDLPIQKLTFAYDHVGRRRLKQRYTWDTQAEDWTLQKTTLFLYDGWNMIFEIATDHAAQDTQHTANTWGLDLSGSLQGDGGIGGLLFTTLSGPNFQSPISTFPTYDGNGNVMQYLAAADAAETAAYTYSPFGQTLTATGNAEAHPYRFSTKYTDETGLVYYGHRYLVVWIGRWLNRDPLEEVGGLSLSGFLRNQPIFATDALGLKSSFIAIGNPWITFPKPIRRHVGWKQKAERDHWYQVEPGYEKVYWEQIDYEVFTQFMVKIIVIGKNIRGEDSDGTVVEFPFKGWFPPTDWHIRETVLLNPEVNYGCRKKVFCNSNCCEVANRENTKTCSWRSKQFNGYIYGILRVPQFGLEVFCDIPEMTLSYVEQYCPKYDALGACNK